MKALRLLTLSVCLLVAACTTPVDRVRVEFPDIDSRLMTECLSKKFVLKDDSEDTLTAETAELLQREHKCRTLHNELIRSINDAKAKVQADNAAREREPKK